MVLSSASGSQLGADKESDREVLFLHCMKCVEGKEWKVALLSGVADAISQSEIETTAARERLAGNQREAQNEKRIGREMGREFVCVLAG